MAGSGGEIGATVTGFAEAIVGGFVFSTPFAVGADGTLAGTAAGEGAEGAGAVIAGVEVDEFVGVDVTVLDSGFAGAEGCC